MEEIVEIIADDTFESNIYCVSRTFARAMLTDSDLGKWSGFQAKIFSEILSKINWQSGCNSNVIDIDNEAFLEKLNRSCDGSEIRKAAYSLREELDFMMRNSAITIQDPYTKQYFEGYIITNFEGSSQTTAVTLNPRLMPHFEKLYYLTQKTKVPFLAFFTIDEYKFRCKFSRPLLYELKSCCKMGGSINTHSLTTRQLKELFNLDIGAYMRDYDDVSGEYKNFDRANFEKYTLNRAIEELNRSCMVSILPYEDGSYYEKIKKRGKVTGYRFRYKVYTLEQMKKRQEKLPN